MKKLSKKQRHNVYIKALKELICFDRELLFNKTFWDRDCICHSIMRANYNDMGFYDDKVFEKTVPELFLFEPNNFDPYWFSSKEERIIVLMFCIEMTK